MHRNVLIYVLTYRALQEIYRLIYVLYCTSWYGHKRKSAQKYLSTSILIFRHNKIYHSKENLNAVIYNLSKNFIGTFYTCFLFFQRRSRPPIYFCLGQLNAPLETSLESMIGYSIQQKFIVWLSFKKRISLLVFYYGRATESTSV